MLISNHKMRWNIYILRKILNQSTYDPINAIPKMTKPPPIHWNTSARSCSIQAENNMEVSGMSPENAAAVNAPLRLMPPYQQRYASAVTKNPYQPSAIHPGTPREPSRAIGFSSDAGSKQNSNDANVTSAV